MVIDEPTLTESPIVSATSSLAVHQVTLRGHQDFGEPSRELGRTLSRTEVTAEVVMEEPLAVEVNGREVAILMRLPGQEKELAVGFCLSEGLLSDFRAVQLVHHCGQSLPSLRAEPQDEAPEGAEGEREDQDMSFSRNRVQIRVDAAALRDDGRLRTARLIRSGCGAVDVAAPDTELPIVTSPLTVEAKVLLGLNAAMRQLQKTYRQAGGVHAAALFEPNGHLVTLQEDIGRHNAMDKVLGYCLLRGIPLVDKVLLSTGRASYEMISKAARLGLPVVASVSSPTSLAVQLAIAARCTLIGYLRGKKMIIYTHPWRVIDSAF